MLAIGGKKDWHYISRIVETFVTGPRITARLKEVQVAGEVVVYTTCVVPFGVQLVPRMAQRERASRLRTPGRKNLSRFVTPVEASNCLLG